MIAIKKRLLVIGALLLGSTVFAQGQQQRNIIDADKLSEAELQQLDQTAPKDGWVLLKFKGEQYLRNFSNEDYIMSLFIQCADSKKTPGYLIEYSKNYGDKDWGGLDFISSADNSYGKAVFYLDGKSFGDPFANVKDKNFSNFYAALKTAKVLKIEVFNDEPDEDGKQQLKLNRAIDFKLANGSLLDERVRCR